jgi:hypothetical protein
MACEFRIMDFNYLFQDNVALSSTTSDASFPVANLSSDLRAKKWRSTGVTDEAVTIDLKTTESIDSIVILTDGINDIKLSPSATVSLQGNATNSWGSPALDTTLTFDETNEVFSHYFATDQTYRYFRVRVQDSGNPFGHIELSQIILSKATVLSQGPNKGFGYSVEDQSESSETPFGHVYNDIYPNRKELDFEYTAMTLADMELLANIYDRVGNVKSIAVALDTGEDKFDKDRFFVYGKLKGSVDVKHLTFSFFGMPWGVEENF